MLTISKPLSSGQARSYHREEFANAQDNYYTEGNQIRGQWHGKLAAQWGLIGEVQEEHFARLANGQHPLTGAQLVQSRAALEYIGANGEKIRSMEHRAGWDATFSAPKSVSLTALVGGDERVRMAHRESVEIALNELEKFVQARIGSNHAPETTGKWAAAQFEHDSSRPVKGYAAPQLHTHVVLFNLTERSSGETRALQPRELYRSQQYATAVYRSELALRLRDLGYEIERSATGAPEIKGYTHQYLEASSPRRQQINNYLEEQGKNGAASAQIAAHRTRDDKLDVSHQEMQRRHQEMAAEHGHQPERIVQAAHERQGHRLSEQEMRQSAQEAVRYAVDRNFERQSVSGERELMRDALKRTMGETTLSQLQQEFQKQIEHGELIQRQPDEARISREFTTQEMIRMERENIRFVQAGQNQHEAMVSFETRRAIEQDYSHLSNTQRGAVEEILGSRDQVVGLEGVAGAGKTTSLTAVRDAAEREGYHVEGFAPTSRAAQKLSEAGMECHTLQHHLARGTQDDNGKKRLYVVDESSLTSTRQMNEFLHGLGPQDRVLLVGDVRQHQGVEAGKPYEQLQEAGMRTARLDEIVRQKDLALKEAVEQLSRGHVREAVEKLEQQGRIQEISNREERLKAIAQDYCRAPEGALVVSPDNRSRRDLNLLIHRELQERGQVQSQEHTLKVLESRQDMTGADRAWAAQYSPGDVVRYSRGSQVLGIKPGEYATVAEVNASQNRLTVEKADGQQVDYDPRRLRAVTVYREADRDFAQGDRIQFTAPSKDLAVANRELGQVEEIRSDGQLSIRTDSGRTVEFKIEDHPHLDYGYALTSHSSQGQTADRVLVHADTEMSEQLLNTRMAYVAVSRGRYDAQIYTDDREELAEHLSREHSHSTAIEATQEQHESHDHGQEKTIETIEAIGQHDDLHAGPEIASEPELEQVLDETSAGPGQSQGIGE
ncbi:MAG TPA: MobF family relaxase [Candidatus Angelobacter sp.]|jgi:conjugative relaxase-like TrwC/TraI family protein|nr:MobF family relaxase [Candidatus Angelobacter sp.]